MLSATAACQVSSSLRWLEGSNFVQFFFFFPLHAADIMSRRDYVMSRNYWAKWGIANANLEPLQLLAVSSEPASRGLTFWEGGVPVSLQRCSELPHSGATQKGHRGTSNHRSRYWKSSYQNWSYLSQQLGLPWGWECPGGGTPPGREVTGIALYFGVPCPSWRGTGRVSLAIDSCLN